MTKNSGKTGIEIRMEALDTKELDDLAQELPLIKLWVSAVEAEIERRLIAGEVFKFAAMRDKQAIRKWDDSVDIEDILTDYMTLEEAAPRVPLSPSKVEKMLGRAKFESLAQYVRKVSSGKTMDFVNPGKSIFLTEN